MADKRVYEKLRKQKNQKFRMIQAHIHDALEYDRWLDEEIKIMEERVAELEARIDQLGKR